MSFLLGGPATGPAGPRQVGGANFEGAVEVLDPVQGIYCCMIIRERANDDVAS